MKKEPPSRMTRVSFRPTIAPENMIYLYIFFTGVVIIGFTSDVKGNSKDDEISLSDETTQNSKGKIYHDYIAVDSSEEDYAEGIYIHVKIFSLIDIFITLPCLLSSHLFHILFLDYQDNRAGNIWPNTDEVINHEPNIDQYRVTEEQTNIGQHWHMLERNECDRVCSKNEIPKTCHFKFIIEQHTSMGKVAVPRFNISMIHTFI